MMNWLKVLLFWRRVDPNNAPRGPVMVHWRRASGSAKIRIAVWRESRAFDGNDLGPGFVDWWAGDPLGGGGAFYWRRLPLK